MHAAAAAARADAERAKREKTGLTEKKPPISPVFYADITVLQK